MSKKRRTKAQKIKASQRSRQNLPKVKTPIHDNPPKPAKRSKAAALDTDTQPEAGVKGELMRTLKLLLLLVAFQIVIWVVFATTNVEDSWSNIFSN